MCRMEGRAYLNAQRGKTMGSTDAGSAVVYQQPVGWKTEHCTDSAGARLDQARMQSSAAAHVTHILTLQC